MVGTNDLEKSSKFYDLILAHLGMKRITITERYIGYGLNEDDADIILAQLPTEKNETLEKEKYPVDDTGNTPWGYGRDPDLYD